MWGGRDFSADHPGVVAELLSTVKGDEMMTLFTSGATGNINQINVETDQSAFGPAETRRVGTVLAAAVMKAYARLDPLEDGALQVGRRMVSLAVPAFTPAEVEEARSVVRRSWDLAIKAASPFQYTIVSELANDMLDYIPDRKAYEEGGYEVTNARCLQGCGERLVEAAVELLTKAHAASSPYRPEGGNDAVARLRSRPMGSE